MKILRVPTLIALVSLLLPLFVGCDAEKASAPTDSTDDSSEAEPTPTNRVSIPAAVRSNLGISFVKVERRRVARTLRVPGTFELQPSASREYRTMLPGQVELAVNQFEQVEAGTLLYTIDSPAWRELQQAISEIESFIIRLEAKLKSIDIVAAAHQRHEQSIQESVALWVARVDQIDKLREAGGGRVKELAEARSTLSAARSELAEVEESKAISSGTRAETAAELAAAGTQRSFLLDSVSSLLGVPRAGIAESPEGKADDRPLWARIDRIEVRAIDTGIVAELSLTNGAWAEEKDTVLTVVQPDRLRFHAAGLQSDLGVLRDGLPAVIVPPAPTTADRSIHLQDTMTGTLTIGLGGDSSSRTLDLYVTPKTISMWARPDVAAHLEIETEATDSPELAIPLAAVQRDGIRPVIFRRSPDNPDEAIRLDADLGVDDGRWIAVLSSLRDGDEIVLNGAFQLMLATSGGIQKGGHFHSDGTFHDGEH